MFICCVNNTLATSRQIGYTLRKTFPNLPCHFHKYLISLFSFSQYFWEHWLTEVQCFSRRVGIVRVCYSICSNYFSRFGLVWVCHSICSSFSAASALCECVTWSVQIFQPLRHFVCHSIFSHFSAASALCVTRFSLKNYQTGRTLSQSVNHSSVCTSKSKFLTNCFPNYHHQTRRLEK